MSAADDIMEMQGICEFIAERLAISPKDKDRTSALYDAFNPKGRREERISWNRCFEFLKAKARLVQSWEKDLARAEAEAIRRAERERKASEHVEWLRQVHQRAVQDGSDMDRTDLAALERVLARVGALDCPVGSPAAEDQDQSINW